MFASVNFFAALSEEPKETFSQPVTKTNTKSSKKEDKHPKSDASKAKPKKRDPNANNAAFKDKNAGREANKKVPVNPEASARPRSSGNRDDRKSKSGKKDTQKREKSGWGDNNKELQEEEAGEAIAKEDVAEEAAEEAAEEVDNSETLEEYLAKKSSSDLNVARSARKPNEGSDASKWANGEVVKKPELVANGPKKQGRNKARKEIVTLEPSSEHLPSMRPQNTRSGRDSDRRGGRKGPKKQGPNFDTASLPRLN